MITQTLFSEMDVIPKKKFDRKSHMKVYMKQYYENNSEKIKKRVTKRYENNRENISEYQKKYRKINLEKLKVKRKEWCKKNPEKIIEADLRKYGITFKQYNEMLIKQNNICAICNKPETAFIKKTNKIKALSVDHCHTTGKIRGLLCHKCNYGIGMFKENIKSLSNAIKYLKLHLERSPFL